MPGSLPKIKWESTKYIEKVEGKVIKEKRKGRTVVVRKEPEVPAHLDVFDRAKADGKPVLLYITMKKCDPCRTMEKLILRQATVTKAAKRYHSVMLAIDVIPEKILKDYKIKGSPSLLLFNYKGKHLAKIEGRVRPSQAVAVLEKTAGKNATLYKKDQARARREAERARKREAARKKKAASRAG